MLTLCQIEKCCVNCVSWWCVIVMVTTVEYHEELCSDMGERHTPLLGGERERCSRESLFTVQHRFIHVIFLIIYQNKHTAGLNSTTRYILHISQHSFDVTSCVSVGLCVMLYVCLWEIWGWRQSCCHLPDVHTPGTQSTSHWKCTRKDSLSLVLSSWRHSVFTRAVLRFRRRVLIEARGERII